jgi:Raf kinase inhibitor-like YbhB/YbcL family protein
MKLTSSAFQPNQPIPAQFTCDGQNTNPPLAWSDLPANTKSLALIMDDPDAPVGLWVHWLVWNITPASNEITADSVPTGATEGTTSSKTASYGGPCPPSGIHHYHFKLYALDTTLDLPSSATKDQLESAMTGHILDQTDLVGLYSRPEK